MIHEVDTILFDPSLLLTFQLLTHSDLKAYRFTYWMGVPAVIPTSLHPQAFMSTSVAPLKDWMMITSDGSTSNSSSNSGHSRGDDVDVINVNQLCIGLYRQLIRRLITSHRHDCGNGDDGNGNGGDDEQDLLLLQCIFGLYIEDGLNNDKDDGGVNDVDDNNIGDYQCVGDVSHSDVLMESYDDSTLMVEGGIIESTVTSDSDNEEMLFVDKPYQPWQYEGNHPYSNDSDDIDVVVDSNDSDDGDVVVDSQDKGVNSSSSISNNDNKNNRMQILSLKNAWPLRYDTKLFFVVVDSSSSSSTGYGWIIRNLLVMLSLHLPDSDVSNGEIEGTSSKTARIINFRGAMMMIMMMVVVVLVMFVIVMIVL